MSQWTHIQGIIRYDNYGIADYDQFVSKIRKLWGKTWGYNDINEENYDEYKKSEVPKGSDGSIQYDIVKGRSCGGSCRDEIEEEYYGAHLIIWADLRDYSDAKEIMEWIRNKTQEDIIGYECDVRTGVVEIDVEFREREVWVYHYDKWVLAGNIKNKSWQELMKPE